jgi:mannose/fructose/N-acetylgalactosamine-specific phosphotransferase system component IID
MDRYTAIVAVTSMILGTVMLGTFVAAFVHLRTRRNQGLDMGAAARIEDRLTRIEQAMDTVAVEVERISEAQRFTTKLLSERTKEQLRA